MTESDLLGLAVDAAQAAGRHALRNLARRRDSIELHQHDIKLKLDVECQAIAQDIIQTRFPGHAFLGEEGTASSGADDDTYQWIVDPIDGTVNFSHGLPYWCCSVAVRRGSGAVLAGVVYAPALDELYCATRGEPATCNGSALAVSDVTDITHALVLTGTDKSENTNIPSLSRFGDITKAVQRTRILGAAALDLCRVAAGQADGYFESGIYLWDVAAGGLILESAGGRVEVLKNLPRPHHMAYLGTNGRVHGALRAVVQTSLH